MRWESSARQALRAAGFTVIAVDGVSDYQGWGVLLGVTHRCLPTRRRAEFPLGANHSTVPDPVWAVLSWSYGSCNCCDAYEDMSDDERAAAFASLIEEFNNEDDARLRFDARKGW